MPLPRNRRVAVVAAVSIAVAAGYLARPSRYVVEGVSMGPGLVPGDVVASGWCDGWTRWLVTAMPGRFERRIVTLPDGSTGLKRVIGLPGETVSIADGDVVIDGRRILKGPRLIAEMGSVVADVTPANAAAWIRQTRTILDEAPFAPEEVSRLMLPVVDGGFAIEATVPPSAFDAGTRVWARGGAGDMKVRWRIKAAGRYTFVMGRLDGHAVAAAWPLPETRAEQPWRCIPSGGPDVWDVTRPWPGTSSDEEHAGFLSFSIGIGECGAPLIDRIVTWRDIFYRPAADGVATWNLEPGSIFVLGDFPSGSRDSRHFGPLPLTSMRSAVR
jgi:type IV secretory pathway protease TraF